MTGTCNLPVRYVKAEWTFYKQAPPLPLRMLNTQVLTWARLTGSYPSCRTSWLHPWPSPELPTLTLSGTPCDTTPELSHVWGQQQERTPILSPSQATWGGLVKVLASEFRFAHKHEVCCLGYSTCNKHSEYLGKQTTTQVPTSLVEKGPGWRGGSRFARTTEVCVCVQVRAALPLAVRSTGEPSNLPTLPLSDGQLPLNLSAT